MESSYYFSLTMPVYNKAQYVARALDSVFAQTFDDYELVIVDDQSSDDSLKVIEQYFEEKGGMPVNVKIIHQQHAGVGAARNNGVANSTGQHLVFIDADDWWLDDYLSEMHSLIERWPQAELFGTSYYILKDGEKKKASIALNYSFKEGLIVYHEVYDKSKNLCMPLTANSYCITRHAFENIGGYRTDLTLGEDFYLWLKASLAYPLAFLNKPLSVYCHDVNPEYRAMGKRHTPDGHVIFHLEDFKEEEVAQPTLKKFLDRLRVGTLDEYFYSFRYLSDCRKLVQEVDWSAQNRYYRLLFHNRFFPYELKIPLHLWHDFWENVRRNLEPKEKESTSVFSLSICSFLCIIFAGINAKPSTYLLIPLLFVGLYVVAYFYYDSKHLIRQSRAAKKAARPPEKTIECLYENPTREKTLEEEIAEFYLTYY